MFNKKKFISFRKLIKQVRRKLSFDSWRKEKNLMYRKLKEAEEKKQQELQKKLKDIECKKVSQEVSILEKVINY